MTGELRSHDTPQTWNYDYGYMRARPTTCCEMIYDKSYIVEFVSNIQSLIVTRRTYPCQNSLSREHGGTAKNTDQRRHDVGFDGIVERQYDVIEGERTTPRHYGQSHDDVMCQQTVERVHGHAPRVSPFYLQEID